MIVVGRCVDQVGGAVHAEACRSSARGRTFDVRKVASIYPHDAIRRTIATPAIVDANHDGRPLGRIEHVELADSGVWLVCELRDSAPVSEPAEFSMSVEYLDDPRDGWTLRNVALVRRSAMQCHGSVTVIPDATLRRLPPLLDPRLRSRGRHHLADLLARASDAAGRRRHGDPIVVVDRRPRPTIDLPGGLVIDERTGDALGLRRRVPAPVRVPALDDDDRPPGPIEYRPARIVRVR